jgi:Short C-terminal domain
LLDRITNPMTMIALLLFVLGAGMLIPLFHDGVAETMAKDSSCNEHVCSVPELRFGMGIGAGVMFFIGGILFFIGMDFGGRFLKRSSSGPLSSALSTQGVDSAFASAAADPATTVLPAQGEIDRLQKLTELRAAGLITQDEFEQHRERIRG